MQATDSLTIRRLRQDFENGDYTVLPQLLRLYARLGIEVRACLAGTSYSKIFITKNIDYQTTMDTIKHMIVKHEKIIHDAYDQRIFLNTLEYDSSTRTPRWKVVSKVTCQIREAGWRSQPRETVHA